MEETLRKHKESLISLIKESEKKENHRIHRLVITKHPAEHAQLLERYNRERQHEQDQIENLANDMTVLQKLSTAGKLQDVVKNREEFKRSYIPNFGGENALLPNRFAGFEDHAGVVRIYVL